MESSSRLPFSGRQYDELLDVLYATPMDQNYWSMFLDKLVRVSRSRSARLLVLDRVAEQVQSSMKINIDDSAHQQYVDHFVNACPWRPELKQKPPGQLYSTYLDFSCRQNRFYQTEFYNDWARGLDIHHGVCGTVYQNRDHTVQLLVQRTRDHGPYHHVDTTWFNGLVPHIRRAIQLNLEAAGLRRRALAGELAAHRPFILLGPAGRVDYLCQRAEALLANENALLYRNGRLMFRHRPLQQRFLHSVNGILTSAGRDWRHAGDLLLAPRLGDQPLACLLSPLAPEVGRILFPVEGRALLHFHLPEETVHVDEEHVATLFGLTPAEAKVARAIAEGGTLADLADRQGISVQTARSQLKSVFRKTGTTRQNELAARVLKSPALSPAPPPITLP